jgi:hypothetical protein
MGRKQAEALMESTCIITRASPADPPIDPATGLENPPTVTTIYTGKCRLRFPFVRPEQALAAGQQLAKDRGILSLPITGSDGVKLNDLVDVTIGPLDPGTVRRMRIMAPFEQTHATARRFPVEVASEVIP